LVLHFCIGIKIFLGLGSSFPSRSMNTESRRRVSNRLLKNSPAARFSDRQPEFSAVILRDARKNS
jgi:hypothetical protein